MRAGGLLRCADKKQRARRSGTRLSYPRKLASSGTRRTVRGLRPAGIASSRNSARAAKAEATRARIRAAAIALYTDRPIEDFTLEEVAKRAQTTVQTVLRAFGSKEELVYEALDE